MLSIVPLDVYDTKMEDKSVIKLTNNNPEHFDSKSNKRKMAQGNIKVVENLIEDESLVMARRISKLFKLYTEKETMEDIKKRKQIDVKWVGLQDVGMGLNMFIHCKCTEDAEELAGGDLVQCNMMTRKISF